MKRAILAVAFILASTAAAHAEGTMKVPKDYNVLEVQDGQTTYKIGIEQLKRMLREKTKEAVKDGNADITGIVEIKEPQTSTLRSITGTGTSTITPYYYGGTGVLN